MLHPRRQTIYPADALTNPMSFIINYQQDLNPAQYEAATTLDGPLLVVAGAGSGKTRTIVYRLARLIEEGVPPQQILLLTFTRKAAQEMTRRAERLLDLGVSGLAFAPWALFNLLNPVLTIGFAVLGLRMIRTPPAVGPEA